MLETCEDCGTILDDGICQNCQEEIWIETYQGDEPEEN
jgi:hypothetical protein